MEGARTVLRERRERHAASLAAALSVWLVLGPIVAIAADPVVEAFRLLESGRPEQALALFQKALDGDPDSPELLTYVGLGHFKNGQYAEALEAFDQARTRDPDIVDSSFLFYRSSTLRGLGLMMLERAAWKEVIDFDPQSRFAQKAREALTGGPAQIEKQTRDLVENGLLQWDTHPMVATAYLREALARSPSADAAPVLTYLAALLNQSGHYHEVLDLERKYHAPQGRDTMWLIQMAVARMGLQEWELATHTLSRISSTSPEWNHKAQFLQAVCLVRLDRDQQARTLLHSFAPDEIPEMERDVRTLLEALDMAKPPAGNPNGNPM